MYKKIILFAALAAVGLSSKAQLFDLSNNSERFAVCVNLGQAGFGTEYSGFGFGAGVSLFGVYVDCLINPPSHQYDTKVTDRLVPDQKAITINFGYQIPILHWLRIAPIIGYSQTSYGYVDYSTVNVEVDSQSSTGRIRHDYKATEEFDEFNFGGAIFIQPIPNVELGFVGTRRAIYGSIGFAINSFDSGN